MDAQQRLLLEVSHEVIGAAAATKAKPKVRLDLHSRAALSTQVDSNVFQASDCRVEIAASAGLAESHRCS